MHRRRFIALLGGAIALPRVAAAQQKAMPVIGYLNPHLARRCCAGYGRVPSGAE